MRGLRGGNFFAQCRSQSAHSPQESPPQGCGFFSLIAQSLVLIVRYALRMSCSAFSARMGLIVAALFPLPAFASTAHKPPAAPPKADAVQPILPETFRRLIEQGIANGAYRSIAVGLIDGAQRKTLYFGQRDGPTTSPADDDNKFEIGAVSEVFTGLLLAQAAIEGKLRLQDPVRKFLPASFPFGATHIGDISLEALATQHSGLPPQPASLFPADVDDPYADYATEDLLAFLAFYRDVSGPVDAELDYHYSVLNGGLLGHLLGRVYGVPFTELLRAKILAQAGLTHASWNDSGALLTGYARGETTAHWHYGVLAGAAGLRASLPDLLEFLQRNLTPGDSPLRAALLLARQPRAAGAAGQVGLGWNVREVSTGEATWPLVWRASETAGFSAFIGFRTDQQKAIVLLANAAEDLAGLGIAWLNAEQPPPVPRGYPAVAVHDLAAYPGLYQISSDNELIVRANASGLSLQMPGQLPQQLRAVDADVFVARSDAIAVTFMRNVDEIGGLVLHLNGDHLSAQRLSARAPYLPRTPINLDHTVRDQYLGDYRLDTANWMRIAQHTDALSVQLTASARRVIFAYAPDRFSDGDGAVDLVFHRDDQGQISGATIDLAGAQREATPLRRGPP